MPDPAETYRQEAAELLDMLEQSLLDLDHRPDDRDLVDTAFRALHTIKGSGAMFGFDSVAAFTHEFETAFDRVRAGLAPCSRALVAAALRARDHIRGLIEAPDATDPAVGDTILSALHAAVSDDAAAPAPALPPTAPESASASPRTWRICFRPGPDALVNGTNPLLMLEELRGLGRARVTALLDRVPPLDAIDPESCYLGWEVMLETAAPRSAIEEVFLFILDDAAVRIEPPSDDTAAQAEPGPAAAIAATPDLAEAEPPSVVPPLRPGRSDPDIGRVGGSLRVQAERLDALMDRVGELVICQARLHQLAGAGADPGLTAVAEEIGRLVSELRDTTMGIRMVPIGSLFTRFRRLLHDLSRDLGKPVELVTSGEETELDKTMIERMADPLVHLIRNAVDHGLEAPDAREAAGKPRAGGIRLVARHAGAEVLVTVADDGRGLDAERIRAKAVENGLIAADARLTEPEIHQLIFHPGFSTAREISAISGRGVGMDVVKRTIEALRGSIEVTSRPGHGTEVTLRLPLTLAIIEGLLVRVGRGIYAIPLSAVEECVELPPDEASRGGFSLLSIRGALVPFLRLRELLRTGTAPDPYQKVVIIAAGEHRVGLVVDQILGSHQTVIKSLSRLHADVKTFSGATILGDGTVALILDVAQLLEIGQAEEERGRAKLREAA
ncbi:chemotaxis protein CheA [Paracraurococcus ruber]|uniref:Chemotaxis protein CheA n=1 Tax=Paracraurococcus ruber TaxID=77675 RepID=A0ABS1CQE7_9PROT|nr:chemotaxis protein CheA [Paracraurococcus ruber]MBK1656667.1 chemotaxis protein CheA [Paracraurococcus ruber]TDG33768.1 chemotaxis protein CheA [Paracraurococcus ruber]